MSDLFGAIEAMTADFVMADWAMVVLIALSLGTGLARGFAREAMSFLGWVAAFVLANVLAQPVADGLESIIAADSPRLVAAWCIVFIAILVLFSVLGSWLSQQMRQPGFNIGNRILGGMFGVLRGLVIVMVMVAVLDILWPSGPDQWLGQSVLYPMVQELAEWLQGNFDAVLQETPNEVLEPQLNTTEML